MIVPVRGLATVMPASLAMEALRVIVLGSLVLATYVLVRRLAGRPAAVVAAALLSFNTMVLGALGDPYPVRVALPMLGVAIVGFAAVTAFPRSSSWPVVAGAAAGAAGMAHQFAFLLVAACAIPVLALLVSDRGSRQNAARIAGMATGAFFVTVALLLVGGQLVFPGRNWFETTVSTLRSIDASAFASADHGWIAADPALLVPVALLVATAPWLWRHRTGVLAGRVLTATWWMGVSTTALMALSALRGSNVLEFQAYVVFLWPAPLICLGVALAVILPTRSGWAWAAAGSAVVGLLVLGAAWRMSLTTLQGLSVAVPLTVLLLVAARRGVATPWIACVLVGVSAAAPQVLQNATDPLGDPFLARKANWAALASGVDYAADAAAALDNASWVFDQLEPDERIVPWLASGTDLGSATFVLYPAFIGKHLRPDEQAYLRGLAPAAIVVPGHSMTEVRAVRAAVRASGASVSNGTCREWTAPRSSSSALTCIDRVRWRQ